MKAHRRILSVLAVAAMFMGSSPAQAATDKVPVPGTNWFWRNQQRPAISDTGQSCPNGVPACPDQRAPGANPHSPGALPVAVVQGEHEKFSAIQFGLTDIIPSQGATISKFTFSVIESQESQDRAQNVNVNDNKIRACLITESWPASLEGGADEMKDAPDFDEANCVTGTRKTTDPPSWHFNITKIAATWGATPSASYGVMLAGQKGQDNRYQIVLKGPRRDDANTPQNEGRQSAGNIKASITYTPNPAPSLPASGYPSFPSSSTGEFGFGATPTLGTPGAPIAGAAPAAPTASTFTSSSAAPVANDGPKMPWYFWMLIPGSLMALSLVRHTILDPLPGKRADGAVALIRHHNAARLGRSLGVDAASPFAVISRGIRRSGQRIRSLTRRAIRAGRRS